MIIKSLSRREASYGQLYDYMKHGASREDDKYHFIHNCYGRNRDEVVLDFEEHGQKLKKRKNGVYLYHEIISISRSKTLSESAQKEALFEIVKRYANKRAPKQLACGYMHDEKDNNLHFHLMITSNEAGTSNKARLTKAQFSTVKTNLEEWVLANYPELEQAKLISKDNKYKDDKEEFTDTLQSIFSTAKTRNEFHELLKKHKSGYKLRGDTVTFINEKTGKKHRAKTLGILPAYEKMQSCFEPVQNKKAGTSSKKKSSEPNESKGRYGTASEWVFGDFSDRDEKADKEKKNKRKAEFKKQNRQDSKVKDKDNQTTNEKAREAFDEWVYGDFGPRSARARESESEARLKKWRAEQMTNKSASEQKVDDVKNENGTDTRTAFEKTKDTVNEWVFGDFSARDSMNHKEDSAESLKRMRAEQKRLAKENQKGHKQ